MGDLIKSITLVIGLMLVFATGLGVGRDSVRSDIIARMFDGAGIGGNFAAEAIRSGEWRNYQ